MTKLFNDPARFTEDMLVGFLDANARYVSGVPGGVVRAHKHPSGQGCGGDRRRLRTLSGVLRNGRARIRRRRRGRQHLHLTVCRGSRVGVAALPR